MNILSMIETKKTGGALTRAQIDAVVRGYTAGDVPDYQMAALLMAIRWRGMTDEETFELADAMAHSGEMLDLGGVDGVTVDKHSTGGVSDSTTFIVVPLLAELGFKVAKMSGRALGHTGGTIDKLETFGGYRTELDRAEFVRIVNEVGASVIGANGEFAPADKRIYALRDVTGTVDSLPLIASSILSKKLASGASVIVFDVKYGDGALMTAHDDAERLARLMVRIGGALGRKTGALVTSMAQPLGNRIGAGEVTEALETLRGEHGGSDLEKVAVALTERIAELGGRPVSAREIRALLTSGAAYRRLERMVVAHGGAIPASVPRGTHAVKAKASGYVRGIRTKRLGEAVARAGGGRSELGASVDHTVGIDLAVRLGDRVRSGDPLAYLTAGAFDAEEVGACFEIGEAPLIPELIGEKI